MLERARPGRLWTDRRSRDIGLGRALASTDRPGRPDHRPDGLTEHASTFTRRDAVRAIAEALPQGATVEQVEHLTDRILATQEQSGEVVRLGATRGQLAIIRRDDGVTVRADNAIARFTTAELLDLEAHTIDASARTRVTGTTASDATIRRAIARAGTLSDEQDAMVRQLTGSDAGVEVVVGKAGCSPRAPERQSMAF